MVDGEFSKWVDRYGGFVLRSLSCFIFMSCFILKEKGLYFFFFAPLSLWKENFMEGWLWKFCLYLVLRIKYLIY